MTPHTLFGFRHWLVKKGDEVIDKFRSKENAKRFIKKRYDREKLNLELE